MILKLFTCALTLITGLTAATNSYQNAVRASHGCGEYSPTFLLPPAITEAMTMLLPTIIALFLILITWSRGPSKISSVVMTSAYAIFVFDTFINDFAAGYAPCDSKGDESSFGVFLIGMVYMPIVWVGLTVILEFARFVYFHSRGQIFRKR